MKKFVLIIVVMLLACFTLGNSAQHAVAAGDAKYGGILKFNVTRTADMIGYPLNIRGINHEYASIALEGLFQYDPNESGKLIPMLATSWELAPDKSNYTLKLRRDVKFHDGTAFNAQAVKWNLGKWLESKSPIFKSVTSVDVIDDYTVQINLSSWINTMLYMFDNYGTYIISPAAFEKNGESWANYNPVGTAPFKLVNYKRNVELNFEKFKGYYKEGLPLLDGLQYFQIVDPMTAMASLKRGEFDVWMSLDELSASQLAKEGKWEVETVNGPGFFINYNSVDPGAPFYKKKVREALEYAIDRDKIAALSGHGFREGARTIFYGIDYKKAGTTIREYNPEKAKQLLKEAGYPNGFKLKIWFEPSTELLSVTAFQGILQKVGIEVTLHPLEGAAWRSKAFSPLKSDEVLYGLLPSSPFYLKAAGVTFVKGAWPQFKMLKRPDGLDNILDQAFSEVDLDKGIQHLYRAEKLLYDFAFFSPLMVRKAVIIKAPYVKDLPFGYGFIPKFNLEKAWLDK